MASSPKPPSSSCWSFFSSALKRSNKRHMFVLAGQGNMVGRGGLGDTAMLNVDEYRNIDKRIAVLGPDGTWRSPAQHPLHSDREAGIGPGLAFAQAIIDFLPVGEQRIGLIPCASTSSTGISRWTPPRGDLFKAAIASVHKGESLGGILSGVLWQGSEGDCSSSEDYMDRLRSTISGFRTSLGIRDLPVILGELPQFLDLNTRDFAFAHEVNSAILSAANMKYVAVASTSGLGHAGDWQHFSAQSADELGRRYAWKWLEVTGRQTGSLKKLVRDALDPTVQTPNGNAVTTTLRPYTSAGVKRTAFRNYVVGDCVEVWSSSTHTWSKGVIERLLDGVASVSIPTPTGLTKMEVSMDSEFLRPDAQATCLDKSFSVGQAVEVYSNSKQMWCPGVVENSGNGFVAVSFQLLGPRNTPEVLQKVLPINSNDIRRAVTGLTPLLEPGLDSSRPLSPRGYPTSASQLGSSRSLPRLRLPHQDSPRNSPIRAATIRTECLTPTSNISPLSPSRQQSVPQARLVTRYPASDSFNAGLASGTRVVGTYPALIDPATGRVVQSTNAQLC